jgi:AcrR family transcriptional regulator
MAITPSRDQVEGLLEDRARLTAVDPSLDGRRARSERSRAAIVAAVLELIAEIDGMPSTALVAERAGVTQRTLFRHFGSVDELLAEAVGAQAQLLMQYLGKLEPGGTTDERIERLVDLRVALYRRIAPGRRMALALRSEQPLNANGLRMAGEAQRRQIEALFAEELDRLPGGAAERDTVVHALDVATSWEAFDRLVTEQGLDDDRAAAAVRALVAGALRAG